MVRIYNSCKHGNLTCGKQTTFGGFSREIPLMIPPYWVFLKKYFFSISFSLFHQLSHLWALTTQNRKFQENIFIRKPKFSALNIEWCKILRYGYRSSLQILQTFRTEQRFTPFLTCQVTEGNDCSTLICYESVLLLCTNSPLHPIVKHISENSSILSALKRPGRGQGFMQCYFNMSRSQRCECLRNLHPYAHMPIITVDKNRLLYVLKIKCKLYS